MSSYKKMQRTPNTNLQNERGQKMYDGEIKQAFGLHPTDKWPYMGVGPRMIGNVLVWVTPVSERMEGFTHRCLCECPTCKEVVTAGKLHQHMTIHNC
jgi:hypothetical protein